MHATQPFPSNSSNLSKACDVITHFTLICPCMKATADWILANLVVRGAQWYCSLQLQTVNLYQVIIYGSNRPSPMAKSQLPAHIYWWWSMQSQHTCVTIGSSDPRSHRHCYLAQVWTQAVWKYKAVFTSVSKARQISQLTASVGLPHWGRQPHYTVLASFHYSKCMQTGHLNGTVNMHATF